LSVLGQTGSRRIDTLVHDLVETSSQAGDIAQSDEIGGAMLSLRAFMFENVYLGPHSADEHAQIRTTIRRIFEHLVDERGDDVELATDYLAGMTDRFALAYAADLG
jgi:dGTPase